MSPSRFLGFMIWTITANGSRRRNTAGCGVRGESLLAGRPIVTDTGDGIRCMAGHGFRMSRGAGRLITTGDGLTSATAGVGRRSSISVWGSTGSGGPITWLSSGGVAVTVVVIAMDTTTVTGTDSATDDTDGWDGVHCRRVITITVLIETLRGSKRSETFKSRAVSAEWTRAGSPAAA